MTPQDELCINTLRMLAADAVQKANSGHPGMPMGAAPMAYVLWTRVMRHNPRNPQWPDRDRFVLSAGHGSMLLYALLYLCGYDLDLEDIKAFRQWGSKTPGHPEYGLTPGVETTTGPLGQGLSNAVGMAITERHLAARFNRPGLKLVDHYTYALVSDGDLMEGLSHEAASLAGHLGLGKLICLYDDNRISIEGSTELTFTEDRKARFQAYGWHVETVEDGNDLPAIESALLRAKAQTERPSLIAVRTHIGYGSPHKQDSAAAHGEPLGPGELQRTKERLGWPLEPSFCVPEEVLELFRKTVERGAHLEKAWQTIREAYARSHPKEAAEWDRRIQGRLPEDWEAHLPIFPPGEKGMATRAASGQVLNALAPVLPELMGGSADLAPSNKTEIKGEEDFQKETPAGRNIRFGVREHAMGGILNGMALHGGLIPYGGTFLVFSDYMRPAIRLAALMGLRVIYVFTHDSIGLGEDGPTHQPVEHLAALRAIPNLVLIRPCDVNETAQAWKAALTRREGPVALILTRQGVPVLDRNSLAPAEQLSYGGYVLKDPPEGAPRVILLASGSEVHIALEAWERLRDRGIPARVVNLASWELFDAQPEHYRKSVLPPEITARVAVEAGATQGWCRYVGEKGAVVGLDRFGASAPYQTLYERFGITGDRVVEKAIELVQGIFASGL